VAVEPDAGPQTDAQPDRDDRPSGTLQVHPSTGPDHEALTDVAFASKGKHTTKAVPKVDRVQVDVHSKGQASRSQESQPQPGLPVKGVGGGWFGAK
jgi:hypothetical protein